MWTRRNMLGEARGPQEKNNMGGTVCTGLPEAVLAPCYGHGGWRCRPQRTGPSAPLAPGCRVRGYALEIQLCPGLVALGSGSKNFTGRRW